MLTLGQYPAAEDSAEDFDWIFRPGLNLTSYRAAGVAQVPARVPP